MQIISVLFLNTLLTTKCTYLTVNAIYFSSTSKLDNADEQAAQIRRELDGRLQLAEQMARVSICFWIPETYLHVRWWWEWADTQFVFPVSHSEVDQNAWQMHFFLLWRMYVSRGREEVKVVFKGCILCNPSIPSLARPGVKERVYYLHFWEYVYCNWTRLYFIYKMHCATLRV